MSAEVTAIPCGTDGTWLVALHGDHDLATRPQLEQQTSAIWPACKVAVIDLSDVAYMDSGVVRWLLDVERRLEEAGAFGFSIVEGRPGSRAARIFELLHVDHVLACFPTREAALAQAGLGACRPRPHAPRAGEAPRQAA